MTKEEIYDSEIHPLMAQILGICKEHKIALVADFALDAEDFHCTSALLAPEYEPLDTQLQAFEILKPKNRGFALAETTTTMPDGSKRISIKRIS
jgi:hypothetical protein